QETVAGQMLPLLQNINNTQLTLYQDLEDFIKDGQKRAAEEALARQQQQHNELKIEAADQAVYLISTFASFADPKLGHTLDIVGRPAIPINRAFSNYGGAAAVVD